MFSLGTALALRKANFVSRNTCHRFAVVPALHSVLFYFTL